MVLLVDIAQLCFFHQINSRYFRSTVSTENNLVNSFSCDILPEADLKPRQTSKMELLIK